MVDIQTEKLGSVTVAHVSGHLTRDVDETFAGQVMELVSDGDARLVLDLAGLETIDSSGLSSMITIVTRARMSGGDVALAAPNAFVTGVLAVTRLDKFFNVHESINAARAALGGS